MQAEIKWYEQPLRLEDAANYVKENINSAARSFCAIGYYLKRIRDDRLYEEAGMNSLTEFAQSEFGIGQSTVSRYIKVNDRFSKDGNSPVLDEQYATYSQSQLIEMVTMTEERLAEVKPDMTIRQIREMKHEEPDDGQIEGQMEISDFPQYMPPASPSAPQAQPTWFQIPVAALIDENPIAQAYATSHKEPVLSFPPDLPDRERVEPEEKIEPKAAAWYTDDDIEKELDRYEKMIIGFQDADDPPLVYRLTRMRKDAMIALLEKRGRNKSENEKTEGRHE